MKKLLSICLLALSMGTLGFSSTENQFPVQNVVKKTHASHPEISGFQYSYGYLSKVLAASNQYGYIYYDMDVYFCDYTSVSRLYLIHAKGEFTSGYVATNSGQTGFDDFYDLDGGLMSIDVNRVTDNTHASSSITYLSSWPRSSESTSTVTTSYGGSINSNSALEAGVSVDNFTIKQTRNLGLTLSYTKTTSTTSPDPLISLQTAAADPNKSIWTFRYAEYGRTTYALDVYYLFEAKNDGNNYQDYSFGFDISLQLDAVAYHGSAFWPWNERHQYIEKTFNESYGLY